MRLGLGLRLRLRLRDRLWIRLRFFYFSLRLKVCINFAFNFLIWLTCFLFSSLAYCCFNIIFALRVFIWLLKNSCFLLMLSDVFLWFFDNSDKKIWRIDNIKISCIIHWFPINNFLNNLTSFNKTDPFINGLIFFVCLKNLHLLNLLNKCLISNLFVKVLISFEFVLIHLQVDFNFSI